MEAVTIVVIAIQMEFLLRLSSRHAEVIKSCKKFKDINLKNLLPFIFDLPLPVLESAFAFQG